MKPKKSLKYPLLSTLSYFDIFNSPLTLLELKKYLLLLQPSLHQLNYKNLLQALKELEKKNLIKTKDGFYSLKETAPRLSLRLKRHLASQKLWKRAKLVSNLISCLPFVRMVGVCNTLAFNNITKESDIDLFIIVENQRIWLTRGLITLLVSLLGLRRHKTKIAGKICLSFYLTRRAMNLKKIALQEKEGIGDIYLIYWMAGLCVLYSERRTQEKFFKKNQWITKSLPCCYPYHPLFYRRKIKRSKILKKIKHLLEKILSQKMGNKLEELLKYIQLKKMSKNYSSKAREKNTDVIISDEMLKFHEIDRRREYRREFLKRLDRIFFGLL